MRDAEQYIPRAMIKQLRHTPSPELPEAEEDTINVVEHSPVSENSPNFAPEPVQDKKPVRRLSFWKGKAAKKPWKDAEPQARES
jgi:hypothetical protein